MPRLGAFSAAPDVYSNWGISLAVPLDDTSENEGERTETTVFYPWHRVESVRLAREDEQPS